MTISSCIRDFKNWKTTFSSVTIKKIQLKINNGKKNWTSLLKRNLREEHPNYKIRMSLIKWNYKGNLQRLCWILMNSAHKWWILLILKNLKRKLNKKMKSLIGCVIQSNIKKYKKVKINLKQYWIFKNNLSKGMVI